MRAGIPLSISAALAILGCGREPLPVGAFVGQHTDRLKPGTDPVIENQYRKVILNIASDGFAQLEDRGVPWEGRMTRKGEALEIEVYTVAGVNVDRQPPETPRTLPFRLQPNGDIVYGDARLTSRPAKD